MVEENIIPEGMERTCTAHLATDGIIDFLQLHQSFIEKFDFKKRGRIVMDYDPALRKTVFRFYQVIDVRPALVSNGLDVIQSKMVEGHLIAQISDDAYLILSDGKLKAVCRTMEEAEEWITAPVILLSEEETAAVREPEREQDVLYAMNKEKDGTVRIVPMNDKGIIIHGEADAESFIDHLRDCIRTV